MSSDLSQVEHIEMGIPAAVAALMSGSIDGALAAGPLALKALEGGARVLFNGEGLVEGTIVIGVSGIVTPYLPCASRVPQKTVHCPAETGISAGAGGFTGGTSGEVGGVGGFTGGTPGLLGDPPGPDLNAALRV